MVSVEAHSDTEEWQSKTWSQEAVQFIIGYWELTNEEQNQLRDLQNRLQTVSHWKNSPHTVVRFLRARPGDVDAAEKMFRNMIQWRADNDRGTQSK